MDTLEVYCQYVFALHQLVKDYRPVYSVILLVTGSHKAVQSSQGQHSTLTWAENSRG